MPRKVPRPATSPATERTLGALELEFMQRVTDRLRWNQVHFDDGAVYPKPDTWVERWWDREAPDLLADLAEPIDPTTFAPVPGHEMEALQQADERRRALQRADPDQAALVAAARQAAKVRDDDERRWSRKVNKRVRLGVAPSEAFEAAFERLAEWKRETER